MSGEVYLMRAHQLMVMRGIMSANVIRVDLLSISPLPLPSEPAPRRYPNDRARLRRDRRRGAADRGRVVDATWWGRALRVSLRDELIEATARAASPVDWQNGAWLKSERSAQLYSQEWSRRAATAALDAILARLDATLGIETMRAGCDQLDAMGVHDEEDELIVGAVWRAMLATLKADA